MASYFFDAVINDAASIREQVSASLGKKSQLSQRLKRLRKSIQKLAYEFRDINEYELFVNAWSMDEHEFTVQLPQFMADLIESGQEKFARDRNKYETAAMTLLAMEAEQICEAEVGFCPDLTPKNVSIGRVKQYN